MTCPKKVVALAVGFVAALTSAILGTPAAVQDPKADVETLVVDRAFVDWARAADVSALREGVIERIEPRIGMPVSMGKPIGYLRSEPADSAVKKEEDKLLPPFDGVVIERFKHPGQRVRAHEPVVRIGDMSRVRAWAYIPLESAFRVAEGQAVDLRPRLLGERNRAPLPVGRKRFRGKVTFVDQQIQPVAEADVRILAEFDNKEFELRPGLEVALTIYLTRDPHPAIPAPAAGGAAERCERHGKVDGTCAGVSVAELEVARRSKLGPTVQP